MAPEKTIWLIQAASRGIGLQVVAQLLEDASAHVIATARHPEKSEELQALKEKHGDRCLIVTLDSTSPENLLAAVETIRKSYDSVDYLINNGGIVGSYAPALEQDPEEIKQVLLTNVVGTHSVIQCMAPLLRNGKKKTIVNVSSIGGSIALTEKSLHDKPLKLDGMGVGYKSSKAALNMATVQTAVALKDEGFTVICVHPGLVGTDMANIVKESVEAGGGDFDMDSALSPEESAAALLKVFKSLTPKDTGRYLSYDGKSLPW